MLCNCPHPAVTGLPVVKPVADKKMVPPAGTVKEKEYPGDGGCVMPDESVNVPFTGKGFPCWSVKIRLPDADVDPVLVTVNSVE